MVAGRASRPCVDAKPSVPGDLGAELGASYTAGVTLAGTPHMLTVTYAARKRPSVTEPLASELVAEISFDGDGPYRLLVQYQCKATTCW